VEIKRADAPKLTPSMRTALTDLKLDRLLIFYPGERHYTLAVNVKVIPSDQLTDNLRTHWNWSSRHAIE
jgi:hypothetical protein